MAAGDWLELTHLNGSPISIRRNLLVSVSREEVAAKAFRESPTKLTVLAFLLGSTLMRLEVQEEYQGICERVGICPATTSG